MRLRLALTMLAVLSVGAMPAAAQDGCDRLLTLSKSARAMTNDILALVTPDIARSVREVGIETLADASVRRELLPESVAESPGGPDSRLMLEYLDRSLTALPALDALSKSSAILASYCPTR